ncbi:MAG TPA: type IV pilus assembly protein PilM [Candidatus Saccharimonadales bacterium]|nr:type IV pilus assembly protein PilM [Candidatus Saccharimonadales bacterium]
MRALSGQTDFFGLDLGVTGVRAVEIKGGTTKNLVHYGHAAIEGVAGLSDAQMDRSKVATVVSQLLKTTGIQTRNVAVNLPSNRVFTAVVDMDKMPAEELAKTIRFQADSFIPTPLAESKIDWAPLGDSPKDPKKIEVLLSSAPNNYIESRLEMLESLGLNVIAFEPDNMALARSLIAADATQPQMIIDIGSAATDLIVTFGQVPHLSRSIPVGYQALIQSAAQYLGIDQTQAYQFVFKFGLGKDKLEGKVYSAIIGTIDNLVAEIEKSINFFEERYPASKIERVIVTGGASSLPEFPLFLANKFNLNVEIGNPWRNVNYPARLQNELAALSNHFAVAVGLAERDA